MDDDDVLIRRVNQPRRAVVGFLRLMAQYDRARDVAVRHVYKQRPVLRGACRILPYGVDALLPAGVVNSRRQMIVERVIQRRKFRHIPRRALADVVLCVHNVFSQS